MDVSRAELHERFIREFADRARPAAPTRDEELIALASVLGTHLPTSYVQFMRRYGAAYCPFILHLTMASGMKRPDLRRFLTPQQVMTRCWDLWSGKLPVDLFVFATDCLNNAFCFRQSREPQDDAPVWYLASDREHLLELDETFDGLLRWYLRHTCTSAA